MSVESSKDVETSASKSGGFDVGVSIVRTITALVVGLLVGLLGSQATGINEAALTPTISIIVAAAYHAVIRLLEHRWPKLGVLLGWPIAPIYQKPDSSDSGGS